MERTDTPKSVWLAAAASGLIIAGLIIFRLHNPPVNFAYYEPQYLPAGLSVRAKRLSLSPAGSQIEQRLGDSDWVYAIDESAATRLIGPADQTYSPRSRSPTCSRQISPDGATYRLCHWIDYDRTGVYQVQLVKNGTFIEARLPTAASRRLDPAAIARFVDSFQSASTVGLPVFRSNGA